MAAGLLLLASAAFGQEAAPAVPPVPGPAAARPPGYHTHDGLYVQLDLGGGGLTSRASRAGAALEASGGGGQFGIGLGGAVTPSFLVGGRFFVASVGNPAVKLNGTDIGTVRGSGGVSGIGIDLVYYLVPSNFYLGLTPAFTRLVVSDGAGESTSSNVGVGVRLAAGKEWWVSANWALGLNLEYVFSSNRKDFGLGPITFGTSWLGLNLSATYD